MRNDFLVVIPARLASTRFPRKPLALLGGRPIVEWCRRAAEMAKIGPVLIATEDPALARALKPYGANVALTSPRCASGSDRAWEAARQTEIDARRRGSKHAHGPRRATAARFIMNLQGDEPLISAATIRKVADALRDNPWADIATAVVPVEDPRDVGDPNVVKVALGAHGRCLYFSRAPIPFPRAVNGNKTPRHAHGNTSYRAARTPRMSGCYFRHIGIYAYRRSALKRFVGLAPSPLELRESLEQLRGLESGMSIVAAVVQDDAIAIDTPQDLRRARRILAASTVRKEVRLTHGASRFLAQKRGRSVPIRTHRTLTGVSSHG